MKCVDNSDSRRALLLLQLQLLLLLQQQLLLLLLQQQLLLLLLLLLQLEEDLVVFGLHARDLLELGQEGLQHRLRELVASRLSHQGNRRGHVRMAPHPAKEAPTERLSSGEARAMLRAVLPSWKARNSRGAQLWVGCDLRQLALFGHLKVG